MNSRGLLTMSHEERRREEVIKKVRSREWKQSQAAVALGITVRQIKRLCRRYRQEGVEGLVSKRRGRPGNRGLSQEVKEQAIQLAKERYAGFGPTLMSEKLKEQHDLKIGKERLRQLLVEEKLWVVKKSKTPSVHQRRERRHRLGELIQIDGSSHEWFEKRGPRCCLIVFIDDATSRLMYIRFEEVETTQAYFRGVRYYFKHCGVPLSLYSDKHGIFRVNQASLSEEAQTQFGRMCEALGVESICAHSPQAKGRVERANRTLQDRQVYSLTARLIDPIQIDY